MTGKDTELNTELINAVTNNVIAALQAMGLTSAFENLGNKANDNSLVDSPATAVDGAPLTPSPCMTPSITTQLTNAVDGSSSISGFVCSQCKHYNVVQSLSDLWYTVTIGRAVGVFWGWHIVQPLVSGVSGACCKKYRSEEAALAAFTEAQAAGLVNVVA